MNFFELPIINVLLPFLTAFLSTLLLTPPAVFLIKKLGLVDDPKRHIHPGIIHTKPIPRSGGVPLFLGALIAGILFLPLSGPLGFVFFASSLALLVGVIDDRLNARSKEISPYIRFLINILTAIIVVASGITMHFITNPFGGGVIHFDTIHIPLFFLPFTFSLSDILAVIWLIWVMNMLNWSKGVDGQMPGVVAISAIVIGILSLRVAPAGALVDAKLSFIIAGAAAGFLIFNFHPAKIFPGYGATSLYLLLGVASILSSTKLATAILVMGVPLVDFIFTILRRILNKQSPFKGDKKHLHHILLKLGYSQRQIALFYWFISAILGVIALTLENRSKLFAIIMLGVITGGTIFFLHAVTKKHDGQTTS